VHVRERPQSTGFRALRDIGTERAGRVGTRAGGVCNTTTAAATRNTAAAAAAVNATDGLY
jgi:hypothetical protein